MPLKFAANLTLPDDAVTQTFAWLGIKGSGKSYGAMKLAELMLAAGQQVVALDPVGIWYSLRLSAAGTGPSKFKLPILGGLRGDVPLDHRAGKTVATFLADTGTSAILDVSLFHKAKRKEFVADLAEELFHRAKSVRRPVHLFLEEAQMFAPQMAKGEERMLGAIEDIVRVGRNFGLGASMITQRPQSVNKEVLNQAEPLIVFRLIAKHERDAVKNWLEHVGAGAGEMMANLHALKTGECFFWSPAWMEEFAKTRALKRVTYDASSTPTGAEGPAAVELKAVDLGKLEQAMAKSIDEAKANDPKALRAKVAELERKLSAVSSQPSARGIDEAEVQRRVRDAMEAATLTRDQQWAQLLSPIASHAGAVWGAADELRKAVKAASEGRGLSKPGRTNAPPAKVVQAPPRVQQRPTERPADVGRVGDGSLPATQQRILDVVATLGVRGIPPDRECVARWQGIHPNGGRYGSDLAALRAAGLLEGFRLTDEGGAIAFAGETGPAAVIAALPDGTKQKVFETILDGGPFTRETLAAALGIHPNGGRYGSDLAWLRTMRVITERGPIEVTEGARR
ncbi:MAG TPA: hypothetical protein VEQ85_08445 [Lacipirellulaceae bacterium]|nr:hypothetical protein [Lacipirellulaceae bacterium]